MPHVILEYDASNPQSIEAYAKRLIGKTFSDVCDEDVINDVIVVGEDYEENHKDIWRCF